MSELSEPQASQNLPVKDGFEKFSTRNAFVLSLIEDRTTRLNRSIGVYKRRQLAFELVSVSATGVITVLAGINWGPIGLQIAKEAVLILGAFTTVITAVKAFYSPQEIRILYVRTLGKLLTLRNEIKFDDLGESAAEPNDIESRRHFDEFQKIMEEHNSDWRKLRSARTSQS